MKMWLPALMIAASLALTACDTAEERAEKHYQAGLELLQKGDVDRALVEFRNVFDLNGKHRDARLTYAHVERERGNLDEAYSQYLLLVEQYPDTREARFALAEMAIQRSDWPEAERHGREALKLAPQDPLAQMFGAVLDYQKAAAQGDRQAAAGPAGRVQSLLDANPDNAELAVIAYRVLVDRALGSVDPTSALPLLDRAIALNPQSFDWQMLKLRLLFAMNDRGTIQTQLEAMYAQFPEDKSVRDLLTGWYLQNKDTDGAEAFLRRLAEDAAKSDAPDAARYARTARLNVVQFLAEARGPEAAMAEIDRLIGTEPDNLVYQATKAVMIYEAGRQDEAIAALESLLKDAPDTDDIRNIKVSLARIQDSTGNAVAAQARIEEVLKSDPGHVAALKMKARWLIDADRPGDAIIALRTALDQDPRDAEILTLLGQAHERDGARDLAGERYAAAVDVSNRGVAESLHYAHFLVEDGRPGPALSVIDNALVVHARNLQLLLTRAELLIALGDWANAGKAAGDLRALDTPAAIEAANQLGAKLLLRQQRTDEAKAFLDSLTAGADPERAAVAGIVQAKIKAGDLQGAQDYVATLLEEAPQDRALRVFSANLFQLADKPAEAEAIYRALLAEDPSDLRPFQSLYRLMLAQDRVADAAQLLDEALARTPDSPGLNMMKAQAQERAQNWDGAIAIYEKLYAAKPDSITLANNLASLLSAHRPDAESLDRAFAIAHRLRGSSEPAFQDTYGWIAYRRGDYEEALASLEPAAAALPDMAIVQIHLGLTYAALKRTEAARTLLQTALATLPADAADPEIALARQALDTLSPAPAP